MIPKVPWLSNLIWKQSKILARAKKGRSIDSVHLHHDDPALNHTARPDQGSFGFPPLFLPLSPASKDHQDYKNREDTYEPQDTQVHHPTASPDKTTTTRRTHFRRVGFGFKTPSLPPKCEGGLPPHTIWST